MSSLLGTAVQDEALAVLVTPFDDLGREVFAEPRRRGRVVADAPVLGVAELVPQLVDRRLRRDARHVVVTDLAVVLVAVELEVADVREPGRQGPTVDAVVGQVFADVVTLFVPDRVDVEPAGALRVVVDRSRERAERVAQDALHASVGDVDHRREQRLLDGVHQHQRLGRREHPRPPVPGVAVLRELRGRAETVPDAHHA